MYLVATYRDVSHCTSRLAVVRSAVATSIVLPSVVESGPVGTLASVLVWLIIAKTGSLGLAIVAGVGLVALFG